ncbi:MAG TPA: tetratricopeptide repeat protein, partial [Dehalococcoidia bacterium]|nr:tetratricopeptide repeat protein [Dehalococcoidia bacterium]
TRGDSSGYGDAIGYLKQALQLDPNDPLLYFNEGLAYLGQGNLTQAETLYVQASQHTLYTNVAAKTARNDPYAEESYLGGALTPLDLLVQHRSDLKSDVTTVKQLLVDEIDHNGATINPSGKVSQLAVQVFPGELQWTASIANYDPSKDTISTQWYFEDQSKLGWSVIPSVSGPQTPEVDSGVSYANPYFLDDRYLKVASQCLQPGHYKVELYIDGHYAGTAAGDGTQPVLTANRMPDLAVDFCEPNGWSADENNAHVGFSHGFRSSDGSSGAYFIRFQNPQFSGSTDQTANAQGYRDQMVTFAADENMLPSGAGTPTLYCGQQQSDGTYQLPWGSSLDSSCNVQSAFFLGLNGANEAYYSYNGGYMHIGSGIAPDGAVVIAFTFGPSSQWASQSEPMPDVVFDSIVSTQ